jgi:hypothetical protein
MRADFPDFELGAIPPFGEMLPAPEIVDRRVLDHDRVLCNGGDHTHSVLLDPKEIVRAAGARVAARHPEEKEAQGFLQKALEQDKDGRVRLAALEAHYPWIDPAGLEYFRSRLDQAPRDADHALGLVVERCTTREHQERAVAALRFKTEVLWAQLEAIERGDTQPELAP